VEDELSSELSFHLEQQIAENISSGMKPDEARLAAMRTMGNLDHFTEECRDARSVEWVNALFRDVRYAARTLTNNPGFTAVAVISIALGIGVNTALFSVIDAVMLKSLPVADPERLVALDRMNARGEKDNFSYPLFEEIRDRVPVFAGTFASQQGTDRVEVMLPGGQSVFEADLRLVSAGYFDVLGVQPAIGRLLTKQDHAHASSAPAIVISHRFWKSRLNQDPSIPGASLLIGRQPFFIVGVSTPEFFGEAAGQAPDVWAPIEAQPLLSRGVSLLDKPNVSWLKVMARLAHGVDEAGARAALHAVFEQLKTDPGRTRDSVRGIQGLELSSAARGLDELRRTYSAPLRVLMVIVGVVLLIACANVANLLLARGAQRQREIAIRIALGAKRARVVRQLMTENLCIAVTGGALGVLLSVWTTRSLLVLASQRAEPLPLNAGVDLRVLLFTAFACMVSSLLFGLIPAIHATRGRASLTITSTTRPRLLLGRTLVAGQVGLCVVLLSVAGLFLRTLHNLRSQDLGFQPQRLLQVRIDPQASGYKPDQLPEVHQRILTAVRSAPGVLAASMSHSGFGTGISRTCCIAVEGYAIRAGENREVRTNSVLPNYFETVGLPLLLGRTFTSADVADPPRVVIVSKSFVDRYFKTASPIGTRIGWGDPPDLRFDIEIIGVVEDARTGNLRDNVQPILYFAANGGRMVHVRAGMDSGAVSTAVRQAILRADSNVPVKGIRTIVEIVEGGLVVERLMATLAGFFGVLALSLAAVGLYATIDYSVRRRGQEIGIRMALGAQRRTIVAMISREVVALYFIGILLGIPATLAFHRVLTTMLFGVDGSDGPTIATAAGVLAVVGVLAALAPGRRAASVAPATALRYE
jgi:predicted permease